MPQQVAALDWSGFVARLDVAQLKRKGRWQEGIWGIGVVVTTPGATRKSWKPEPASLYPPPLAELELDDGTRVRAGLGSTGRLTIEVQRRRSVVTACELDDGVLRLQGDLGFAAGAKPELHVTRRLGGATLVYPVYVDRHSRPATFLAHLPHRGRLQGARRRRPGRSHRAERRSVLGPLARGRGRAQAARARRRAAGVDVDSCRSGGRLAPYARGRGLRHRGLVPAGGHRRGVVARGSAERRGVVQGPARRLRAGADVRDARDLQRPGRATPTREVGSRQM